MTVGASATSTRCFDGAIEGRGEVAHERHCGERLPAGKSLSWGVVEAGRGRVYQREQSMGVSKTNVQQRRRRMSVMYQTLHMNQPGQAETSAKYDKSERKERAGA